MESKRADAGRGRPLMRRSVRSLSWAGALLALAAGGLVASAQAAEHERATAALVGAYDCARDVRLDYDVAYEELIGSFALVGLELAEFTASCAGRTVVVEVFGPAGTLLGSALLELAAGAEVAVGDGSPIDARDVTAVRVRPA